MDRVIRIYDIQSQSLDNQNLAKIISLHDHKGDLTTTWEIEPSKNEKDLIGAIWTLQNELTENVTHKVEEN